MTSKESKAVKMVKVAVEKNKDLIKKVATVIVDHCKEKLDENK